MTTSSAPPREVVLPLVLRGGNLDLYNARDPEILAEGPAGTGKTRTWLELINDLCHHFAGLQVLMVRKTQVSMPTSCIKEFKQHVLHSGDGVYFYGGSKDDPPGFRYGNGSFIGVGGMDNPEKILSSFWDLIYVNEATELSEDDWETLTTRLRGSDVDHVPRAPDGTPFTRRRIGADCNPTYASHWLMRRTDEGKTRLIRSKLQDNPAYFNDDGTPTEAGADYIAKLERLTGIRRERFLLGRRVGVENAIYPIFDRSVHMRPIDDGLHFKATIIGVDYGSRHLCAVAALSIDQWNRRWVREVWAEVDNDQGESLTRIIGQFKERYHTSRGRVDPNQAYLAGRVGFNVAKGGTGAGAGNSPRLHRIDLMEPLFSWYEGGRVPTFGQEINLAAPRGPFAEPDSPGFFIVQGCRGGEELAEEIESYRYVLSETPRGVTKDVYRDHDDRIAAVEYANEEWEEGPAVEPLSLPRETWTPQEPVIVSTRS